jgi:hypothetical protein
MMPFIYSVVFKLMGYTDTETNRATMTDLVMLAQTVAAFSTNLIASKVVVAAGNARIPHFIPVSRTDLVAHNDRQSSLARL